MFNLEHGDKLLNSAHCYLSTTAGPIAGLIFVSTHVVAFCSDRPIIISSPHGEIGKIFYKVINISFLTTFTFDNCPHYVSFFLVANQVVVFYNIVYPIRL